MKTQYEVRVVLIPVDRYSNGRKVANLIQGERLPSIADVKKIVESNGVGRDEGNGDAFDDLEILVYEMNNFMEDCNEQQINLEHFWVSYVHVPTLK
jgi:hypothetical protein